MALDVITGFIPFSFFFLITLLSRCDFLRITEVKNFLKIIQLVSVSRGRGQEDGIRTLINLPDPKTTIPCISYSCRLCTTDGTHWVIFCKFSTGLSFWGIVTRLSRYFYINAHCHEYYTAWIPSRKSRSTLIPEKPLLSKILNYTSKY